MLNQYTIEAMQETIEEIITNIFGELQSEFDMKRECIDLDKFEKVKRRWIYDAD